MKNLLAIILYPLIAITALSAAQVSVVWDTATGNIVSAVNKVQHNVKDYGAVGDGVADDTSAIQTALDLGGYVFLPAGTYKVGALNVTVAGTTIGGVGYDSVLKRDTAIADTTATTVLRINKGGSRYLSNVTVENLRVDGSATGSWGYSENEGINADNTENLTIRGCWIHDTGQDAIDLDGLNPGAVVVYNHITNARGNGIHTYGVRDGDISFNTIEDTGVGWSAGGASEPKGIDLTYDLDGGALTVAQARPENTTVIGNKLYNISGTGISTTSVSIGLKIVNNTVDTVVTQDGHGQGYSIAGDFHYVGGNRSYDTVDTGIYVNTGDDCVLVGNISEDSDTEGFLVTGNRNKLDSNQSINAGTIGFSITGTEVVCAGNSSISAGSRGVYLSSAEGSFSDGHVSGSTTEGIYSDGVNSVITGNVVETAGTVGISVHGAESSVSGNSVLSATGDGIYAISNRLNINSNSVDSAGSEGIRAEGDDIVIAANRVDSAVGSGIFLANGDRFVVSGNSVFNAVDANGISINSTAHEATVTGNNVSGSNTTGTSYGVTISGQKAIVVGNRLAHTHAIILSGTSTDYVISGNRLNGSSNDFNISGSAPTTGIIANNYHVNDTGNKVVNRGTATVATGTTSIAVSHGLRTTPETVVLTATNSTTSAKWWVTAIGATQFTINVDADPTSAGQAFNWEASLSQD